MKRVARSTKIAPGKMQQEKRIKKGSRKESTRSSHKEERGEAKEGSEEE